MRARTIVTGTAVAALAGSLTLATHVASAGPASAPTLTFPAYAAFVVNSQVQTGEINQDGLAFSTVHRRAAWTATDDVNGGICSSELWNEYAGDYPSPQVWGPDVRQATVLAGDYDDQYGGGTQHILDWLVHVKNCLNTEADGTINGGWPSFTQDDNVDLASYPPDATITYSAGWSLSHCTCWSGGTTHKTSTAGASATITKDFPTAGMRVGLVMERGPGRGRFKVLVDGVLRATVDTFRASARHRVVVWSSSIATTGTHTVKIVNLGTGGRPRIDLDVFLSDRQ